MTPLVFAMVDAAYRHRAAYAFHWGLHSEAALQAERLGWWRSTWMG